ncbi:hypothetical protein AWJ20_2687 [Sugiyamaella lignohabitans]|uniref:Zn(2)-C6 fungal-type domain-containing protein n=1 Tax=Sugiyamaella lignohabitans TaxID=796027 RepID=A0A161HMM6_9ASCO|nr:uncharacterized protein AWJ20_2687 [Sugiyamaella lignohabitans]ANB15067.1 hypothetical protein AWJ20_2687 [Sugiyamaella lignohabitans]
MTEPVLRSGNGIDAMSVGRLVSSPEIQVDSADTSSSASSGASSSGSSSGNGGASAVSRISVGGDQLHNNNHHNNGLNHNYSHNPDHSHGSVGSRHHGFSDIGAHGNVNGNDISNTGPASGSNISSGGLGSGVGNGIEHNFTSLPLPTDRRSVSHSPSSDGSVSPALSPRPENGSTTTGASSISPSYQGSTVNEKDRGDGQVGGRVDCPVESDSESGTDQAAATVPADGAIPAGVSGVIVGEGTKGREGGEGGEGEEVGEVGEVGEGGEERERSNSDVNPALAAAAIATFKTISAMNTVRKRRRTPLSCQICRSRKQKCDRGHPCSTCKALRLEKSCVYQTLSPLRTGNGGHSTPSSPVAANGAVKKNETIKIFNPMTRRFYRVAAPQWNLHDKSKPDGASATSTIFNDLGAITSNGPITSSDMIKPEQSFGNSLPPDNGAHRDFSAAGSGVFGGPRSTPSPSNLSSGHRSDAGGSGNPSLVENIFKPTLRFKFNRINYFGPSAAAATSGGLDDSAPEAYTIFNFNAAENKKSWDSLKTSAFPLTGNGAYGAPNCPDLLEKELQIKALADRLASGQSSINEWDKVLDFIPPRDVCDFLIERFLSSVNTVFYSTTASILREDMNYVWVMKRHRPVGDNLDKIEIHKICLILLCLRLARISLPRDWTCSSVTNNIRDDSQVYLGPKLVLFGLSVISMTDIQLEGNLTYIQLLLLCAVNMILTTSDMSGSSASPLTLISKLVESTLSIGLHRDPSNFPEVPVRFHQLWKILWRQTVIADTAKSLELGIPPLINLKYSDTSLYDDDEGTTNDDALPADGEKDRTLADYESLGKAFLRSNLEWCLTCRNLLDQVLLVPANLLLAPDLEKTNVIFKTAEHARMLAYEEARIKVQSKSSLTIREEHCYVIRTVSYLKYLRIRLAFLRVQGCVNTDEMTECALQALTIQRDVIRNASKLSSLHYYLLVEIFRLNRPAWMRIMMMVTSSIVKSSTPVSQHTLATIIALYKETRVLVDTSYCAWKENISMLMALRNVKALSQVVGHSDLDQLWHELDAFSELPVPCQPEWLDYFNFESSCTESTL